MVRQFALSRLCLSLSLLPVTFAAPGDLDGTFDPSPGANASIRAIALQPDGKIVIGGDFTTAGGQPRVRVARLLSNGSLDPDFAPSSGPDNSVTAVDVQTDGKILIAGVFNNVAGTARKFYARLNSNGSLDTAFPPQQPFLASGQMLSIQALPDGKTLMAGAQVFFTITLNRNGVMRLTETGAGDSSFTPPAFSGTVLSAVSEDDGRILVAGAFSQKVIRLQSTGAQDATFNASDLPASLGGFARSMLPAPEGKYIVIGNGGNDPARASSCVRLLSNGLIDSSWTPAGADASILAHAVQPDGAVVIAGDFTAVNGVRRIKVARLTSTGALDLNFNVGEGASTSVHASLIQPNGQILVAGAFSHFNNVQLGPIVRLHGGLFLTGPVFTGGIFGFDAFTTIGKTYILQYKTDLSQSEWSSFPPVDGTGALYHFTDAQANTRIRVYRILEN